MLVFNEKAKESSECRPRKRPFVRRQIGGSGLPERSSRPNRNQFGLVSTDALTLSSSCFCFKHLALTAERETMLKRLSATFSNGNDGPTQYASGHHSIRAAPAPNLSHSTSYNGQTTDVPEGSYAHPSFANGTASSSLSPAAGYGLPRPPNQSTPYSEQGGGSYPGPNSYFPDTSIQYGSLKRSPMPSPRLPSNSQLPTHTAGKHSSSLPGPHQTQPIDRVALQKSLKSVETVLVALDEYRELNVRLAKVEKRLGKSMKELAGSIAPAGPGDKHAEAFAMAPQSISMFVMARVR